MARKQKPPAEQDKKLERRKLEARQFAEQRRRLARDLGR